MQRKVGSYGPLKTKKGKNRKKYKDVDHYLDAIYRANKDYLEKHVQRAPQEKKSKKTLFKERVKKQMTRTNPNTGKKYNIREAIEMVQRKQFTKTAEERIAETRLTQMRDLDKDAFKKFRKEIGWTNKIKAENVIDMTSEGNKNYLRYRDQTTGKDIVIVETISPKSGVSIGYEFIDYDVWREKWLKKHQNDSAANAAEYQIQKILNKARGK